MDWLTQFLDKILAFVPRVWLVQPNEGGVRTTCGKRVRSLNPGIYVYWPLIQEMQSVIVVQQIKDVRCQSVATRDGTDLAVSGAIKYRVKNAEWAILRVQDYDQTLQTLAMGIITRYINERDYETCRNVRDIEETVLKGIREDARGWGIDVMSVYITDLGRTRNIRLLTNGNVSVGGVTS